MPVIPAVLIEEVLKVTDVTNEDFVGFPPDNETASINWSNAVSIYLSTLSTPPGGGAVAVLAKDVAASAMKTALDAGTPGLVELFTAFGVAIATIPVSVPGVFALSPLPPIALTLPPALSFTNDATTWIAAGTFTAPGGGPIPWS